MIFRRLFVFFVFVFWLSNVFSQSQSTLKTYFNDADYDLSQEDHISALSKFMRIFKVDTLNANVNYLIGVCYLNSIDHKQKAYRFLESATKDVTTNYQNGTYDERKAPYDVYLQLGNVYLLKNEYDKAITNFNKFKETLSPKDIELKQKVERKIESCNFAKKIIQHPVKVEKTNLTQINSVVADYNPVVNSEETVMLFTSEELSGKPSGEKRIYFSEKVQGEWSTPTNITDKIESGGNLSTVFLSGNGKTVYFCDDDESKVSLYESSLEKLKWSVPKKIHKKINSGSSHTFASISNDGKTIYFSSNRKGGFGGFDIYKIEKKKDDWGEPVNLGTEINSPFNETCPLLLNDNKTLFFSSEGFSSIGGYDVFYSKKDESGEFGQCVNLGYPFNSSDDNLFYWPVKDGFSGYISMVENDGQGEHDIYFVKISQPDKLLTVENLLKEDAIVQNKDIKNEFVTNNTNSKDTILKKDNTADKNNATHTTKTDSTSSSSLMTILIKVTKNPLESAYLKEIEGVKAYRGPDGMIRYYYGQYKSYEEANSDFDKILKIGFYSAQLKNLSEDTLFYYATNTIDFSSDSTAVSTDITENIKNDNSVKSENGNNKDKTKKNDGKVKNENAENKDSETKADIENKKAQDKKDKEQKEKDKKEKKQKEKEQKEKEKKEKQENDAKIKNEQKANEARLAEEKKQKQTNNAVVISDNTKPLLPEITDKLLNSSGDLFLVQIATLPKTGNLGSFRNISYVTEHDCKDGKYRYTTGVFESKEDARKELEKLKTQGYTDAYIVSFKKFKENLFGADIAEKLKTYNLKYQEEQAKAEETKLYSIQIGSAIKTIDPSNFKVSDVKEKLTRNGYYKYYYGKLDGYQAAKAELEKARNLGYKDAFIIMYTDDESAKTLATKEVENNTQTVVEPSGTYTIQVASSKQHSNLKYFKGLDVKEVQGKNNFYIYIYGEFNSVAAAKTELKKVINLGFKDAYINKSDRY